MPQKDGIHDVVRGALQRAGWEVVAEQHMLEEDNLRVFLDLLATPVATLTVPFHYGPVALEVKSFHGASFVTELHEALGQYLLYLDKLEALGYPHALFLALPSDIYHAHFKCKSVHRLIHRFGVKLLVVDLKRGEIEIWTI